MTTYTPEQVERMAETGDLMASENRVRSMLAAYAATLRQQAARVDEVLLERMAAARWEVSRATPWDKVQPEVRRDEIAQMRAALDVAWPKAALAQNTQGEDAGLYVEARQCEDCDHLGINDSSGTVSACGDCDWQGRTPDEDKCPGCGHENCMAVACPICGGRYRFLADRRFYLHAERARVPDRRPYEAGTRPEYINGWNACRDAFLAAAPSQPKDAARFPFGSWSLDGHWTANPLVKLTAQEQREHNERHGYRMQPKDAGEVVADPDGLRQCPHPDCGRFDGPRKIECRARQNNACACDTTQPEDAE